MAAFRGMFSMLRKSRAIDSFAYAHNRCLRHTTFARVDAEYYHCGLCPEDAFLSAAASSWSIKSVSASYMLASHVRLYR